MSSEHWDGKERRGMSQDYKEVLDRLGSIDVKIGVVETKLDGLGETNKLVRNELVDHTKVDHWVFGIIITILLTVAIKVFTK